MLKFLPFSTLMVMALLVAGSAVVLSTDDRDGHRSRPRRAAGNSNEVPDVVAGKGAVGLEPEKSAQVAPFWLSLLMGTTTAPWDRPRV